MSLEWGGLWLVCSRTLCLFQHRPSTGALWDISSVNVNFWFSTGQSVPPFCRRDKCPRRSTDEGGGQQGGGCLSESQAWFGPPALPCYHMAPKWNLMWLRDVAEQCGIWGWRNSKGVVLLLLCLWWSIGWVCNCYRLYVWWKMHVSHSEFGTLSVEPQAV